MKDWKIRSKIYHAMTATFDDDLSKEEIIENFDKEEIVRRALQYPIKQTKELYYPAKSYAVAVIFAHLLEKEFNEDFYESLSDPNLLFENDPYFKPYEDYHVEIYNRIIDKFPFYLFKDPSLGSENFQKTVSYFYKEMLLHADTQSFLPS